MLSRRSLLAAPLLTACTRRPAGELHFWAMGREGEVAAELVAGFEREHPGVKVRVQALPWTAAHEKLLTAYAGDATPDLAQIGNTWLPELQALGALLPLDDRLPEAGDYFPGIWATNEAGGERVGLPWYVDTRLPFVRLDLLEQAGVQAPPQDWAQWAEALARLRGTGVRHPLLLPTNEFEPLLALALQQSDDLLREGGRYGNFRSPGFARALDFYLQRFRQGDAPGLSNNQVANVWQEFGRGSFAFYVSGPWNIGEFKRRLGAEMLPRWGCIELPGPTGPGHSIAGGASLAIFRRSRQPELAWQLMQYLSRPAVQLQFYRLTGNLPPRRSSWTQALPDGSTLQQDRLAAAFYRQLERTRATPAVPEWERIVQAMQLGAARAVHGVVSAAQMCEQLDAEVDRMLAKRRWMLDRAN